MTALLISAALLAPCHSSRPHGCEIREARVQCERGLARACIRRAALHRGISESWLRSVAWCESRFNPYATNGQYVGLFQFGPVLWGALPYRRYSRFSAKWSALAAALAFRRGLSYQWACA
jgi:soluble lytic murein transglycosylase-like protein